MKHQRPLASSAASISFSGGGRLWAVISNGFIRAGEKYIADEIIASSLDLIKKSGFAEYYDPYTGEPCGGGRFNWTAATVLGFLLLSQKRSKFQAYHRWIPAFDGRPKIHEPFLT